MDLTDLKELIDDVATYFGRKPERLWFGEGLFREFESCIPPEDRAKVHGCENDPQFIFDGVVVSYQKKLLPMGFLNPDQFHEFDPPRLIH